MDGRDLQAEADLAEESSCCLLHDLRNLMCVISHQSEMGHRARHLDAAELRAILGRIHQAARTAIELIEGEAPRAGHLPPRSQFHRMLRARSVLLALAASSALGWEVTPHPLCMLRGAVDTMESSSAAGALANLPTARPGFPDLR